MQIDIAFFVTNKILKKLYRVRSGHEIRRRHFDRAVRSDDVEA